MSGPAEHAEIREAVRRYAREQLAPHAARWDREEEFPREALQGLAAIGLYGIAIPEQWGGAGLDYSAMAIACEEIAAGDCATATIVAVNNLVAGIIHGYGSEAQKEKYLKPLSRWCSPSATRPRARRASAPFSYPRRRRATWWHASRTSSASAPPIRRRLRSRT